MELPIVLVKNLPYDASSALLFELFSKYGPVNQLRVSDGSAPAGTCFVVYTEMQNAVRAAKELSGINFMNRYLVLSLYKVDEELVQAASLDQRQQALEELKKENSIE